MSNRLNFHINLGGDESFTFRQSSVAPPLRRRIETYRRERKLSSVASAIRSLVITGLRVFERDDALLTPVEAELREENKGLRRTVETLQETIRQMEHALVPEHNFPASWKLTPLEARVLRAIGAGPSFQTSERIVVRATGESGRPLAHPHMVAVVVHRLRKKLADHGIEIESRFGFGYRLSPASGRILRAYAPAPLRRAA